MKSIVFFLAGMLLILQDSCVHDDPADRLPVYTGTVTDIDGNTYKTIRVGDQWWMAENLKTTRYRNGDSISQVTESSQWTSITVGAYCNYANDTSHARTFGRLYNWHAINDVRNIAPVGWHIPGDAEWTQLTSFLGPDSTVGGKLKETGTTHWAYPNAGATDECGFSAFGGGYRFGNASGDCYGLGQSGNWWTSTATMDGSTQAWYRELVYDHTKIGRDSSELNYGFSVRCVKD